LSNGITGHDPIQIWIGAAGGVTEWSAKIRELGAFFCAGVIWVTASIGKKRLR
jgi:hypothetical protein